MITQLFSVKGRRIFAVNIFCWCLCSTKLLIYKCLYNLFLRGIQTILVTVENRLANKIIKIIKDVGQQKQFPVVETKGIWYLSCYLFVRLYICYLCGQNLISYSSLLYCSTERWFSFLSHFFQLFPFPYCIHDDNTPP